MSSLHHSGSAATSGDARPPRLLDQVRGRLRRLGMARRSEEAYVGWIRRFILTNGKRHPRDLGAPEIEAFLTDLAVRGNVAASTQNQALAALLFLYKQVLGVELPWMDAITRAKRPRRLPVVLTRSEVQTLLAEMAGMNRYCSEPLSLRASVRASANQRRRRCKSAGCSRAATRSRARL